jgi:phosphomannomutase
MNIKFQEKMNELGLSVNDLSSSLQRQVADFYENFAIYKQSLEDLQEYDGEDKDELQEEVNDIAIMINQRDEELVKNIDRFNRNKDIYASNAQKMAEGRANKKLAKQNNGAISNAVPPTIHEAGVQIPQNNNNITNPVVNNDPNNSNNPAPQQKVKENSSNWGWWALAGIVAVVTLGQVVLKDK